MTPGSECNFYNPSLLVHGFKVYYVLYIYYILYYTRPLPLTWSYPSVLPIEEETLALSQDSRINAKG